MNRRTGNARTTAAIPPRWSSCRCVSRTRSIPVARRARSRPVSVVPASAVRRRSAPSSRSAPSPAPHPPDRPTRSRCGAGRTPGQEPGARAVAAFGGAVHTVVAAASVATSSSRDANRRTNRFTPPRYGHGARKTRKPISGMASTSAPTPQKVRGPGNHGRCRAENRTGA